VIQRYCLGKRSVVAQALAGAARAGVAGDQQALKLLDVTPDRRASV
jgi:hypothetical protein